MDLGNNIPLVFGIRSTQIFNPPIMNPYSPHRINNMIYGNVKKLGIHNDLFATSY